VPVGPPSPGIGMAVARRLALPREQPPLRLPARGAIARASARAAHAVSRAPGRLISPRGERRTLPRPRNMRGTICYHFRRALSGPNPKMKWAVPRYYCSVGDRGSFPSLPLVRKGLAARPSRLMAREWRACTQRRKQHLVVAASIGAGPDQIRHARGGPVCKNRGPWRFRSRVNDAVMYKRPPIVDPHDYRATVVQIGDARISLHARASTETIASDGAFAAALTLTCLGEDSKLHLSWLEIRHIY